MKLYGVVILYRPDDDVMQNISSYIDQLDALYVLDNSEMPNYKLVKQFQNHPKIRYVSFGDNRGVSYALNFAINQCENSAWLLTMDQDSCFGPGDFICYKSCIKNENRVAAYTVAFTTPKGVYPAITVSNFVEKAITSGMIIQVGIAKELGGFDEALFIDGVDHEFCYRLRRNGYKIKLIAGIILNHTLGEIVEYKIGCKKGITTTHSAVREYYITRNNFYILKRYKENRGTFISDAIKAPLKGLLWKRNKWKHMQAWVYGLWDGFRNNMGKCKRKF